MTGYVARRLLAAVPVLFGVSVLIFVLVRITPGDPALAVSGPSATREELELIRRSMGLDQPMPVQYGLWLGRVVQGDFGRSILTGSPVRDLLLQRLGNTALLAIAGLLLSVLIAVPAGILSAIFKGSIFDNLVMGLTLAAQSVASFWVGMVLIIIFAVELRWLPASGMRSVVGGGDVIDIARHMVLPVITMGLVGLALVARMMRSSMLEVLALDHMTTARAKGLRARTVITRHAVKLALLPVVTIIGVRIGYLLGGAVVVETVFSWPGLGFQLFTSIAARDYAFIQAAVLLSAAVFVVINLVVDIAYVFIDPRIRYV